MSAAIAVFAIAGLARADMMSVSSSKPIAGDRHSAVSQDNPAKSLVLELPSVSLGSWACVTYPIGTQAVAVAEKAVDNQDVLVDRSNSLNLCLYALVSLGILRSGQCVRRPSLGLVPEWCRGIGLQQISAGRVAGTHALRVMVVRIIPPDGGIERFMSRQHRGTIACLRRCSMYTPAVLAGRAPPRLSRMIQARIMGAA